MGDPRPLTGDEIDALLHRYPGLREDHERCEECGLLPRYFETDHTDIVRVDACLGFLTSVLDACCGHGGRKIPYVRISRVGQPSVDICGGQVIDYASFRQTFER